MMIDFKIQKAALAPAKHVRPPIVDRGVLNEISVQFDGVRLCRKTDHVELAFTYDGDVVIMAKLPLGVGLETLCSVGGTVVLDSPKGEIRVPV
jgi:hypothetical protein